jgi:hypothetical protein
MFLLLGLSTGELGSRRRTSAKADRSAYRGPTESERTARSEQTCAASGQQSLKLYAISAKPVRVGTASRVRITPGDNFGLWPQTVRRDPLFFAGMKS